MQRFNLVIGPAGPGRLPAPDVVVGRLVDAATHVPGADQIVRVDVERGWWIVAEAIGAHGVTALLESVVRTGGLAVTVWPDRLVPMALSDRCHVYARTAPEQITVGPSPGCDRRQCEVMAGALRMYVALLRRRTPAQWATIDAVRAHVSQARAAEALQCSPQAVSRALQRAHAYADESAAAALQALAPAPERIAA